MRIALVHYHLRRGGVTSVARNQARALAAAGIDVLLIAGEIPPDDFGFPFALVEALGYEEPERSSELDADAKKLALGIVRVMKERWGQVADIVHVHNPLLQKNSLLIPALKLLNEWGLRLLLQNHDLAEDYRPDMYSNAEYPEDCHYAAINSRDYEFLLRAGLRREGLHLLPNEVSSPQVSGGPDRVRYLYPVRAIRRKNIGELLLLSLFIPAGRTAAVTLPPSEAKTDCAHYIRWKHLAAALDLPVEFELGLKHSLADMWGSSVSALSTSVKEGFGFSFLEPWIAGRGISGRRIDYVCADFERAGLRFDSLYSSLEIPLEYTICGSAAGTDAASRLMRKMENAILRTYHYFGSEAPVRIVQILREDLANRDTIDFGRLDEETQETIIRSCHGSPAVKRRIAAINPLLETLGRREDEALITANSRVITEQYGQKRITELLLRTYQLVIDLQVRQQISKAALLKQYLDPRRLSMVGIGDG